MAGRSTTLRGPDGHFTGILAVVVVVSFLVRLVYALKVAPGARQVGDSIVYELLASGLAHGHGYSSPASLFTGHLVPTAIHPPLYPLYLATFINFGLDTLRDERIVSCLLGPTTVLLVGLIGRRAAGPRTGLIAAGLAAVYPNLFMLDGTLLADAMYAPLVALSLWFTFRLVDRPTAARGAALGSVIGLSALARPDGLLLLPFLLVPVAWKLRRRGGLRVGVAGILATVLVLSPWLARNAIVMHHFPLLSTNGALTAGAADCQATFYGAEIGFQDKTCLTRWPTCQHLTGEIAYNDCVEHDAVRYTLRHAYRLPLVVLARLGRVAQVYHFRNDIDYFSYWDRPKGWSSLAFLTYAFLVPLAAAGVFLLRRRAATVAPLLAPLLLVAVVTATSFGFSRYRVAAEIPLVVLAAVTLDHIVALRSAAREVRRQAPAIRPAAA